MLLRCVVVSSPSQMNLRIRVPPRFDANHFKLCGGRLVRGYKLMRRSKRRLVTPYGILPLLNLMGLRRRPA
jgi:hypothetical protein